MTDQDHNFTVKLATNAAELRAAQRLRYRVFVQELGAKTDASSAALGLERDAFDPYFDHLILIDNSCDTPDNVAGVYRLLRGDVAARGIGFYSANEFDLTKLINSGRKTVELGRSCIDPRYRGGVAMQLLWGGLADYVRAQGIEVLFGVASFHGTDTALIADALSFLHSRHLAPENLRVTAHGDGAAKMDIIAADDINRPKAAAKIPSLIKSYLRLGGCVGQGAFVDYAFNTIDVCLVMDTEKMTNKYAFLNARGTKA